MKINLENLDIKELKTTFNKVMDEYAKRLCKMFGYDYDDCFWVCDDRSDIFVLGDSTYYIPMADVKLIVDKNIDYDTFVEYDDYNRCINYHFLNHPEEINEKYHHINLISWINGYTPKVSKEELDYEEKLYWGNLK